MRKGRRIKRKRPNRSPLEVQCLEKNAVKDQLRFTSQSERSLLKWSNGRHIGQGQRQPWEGKRAMAMLGPFRLQVVSKEGSHVLMCSSHPIHISPTSLCFGNLIFRHSWLLNPTFMPLQNCPWACTWTRTRWGPRGLREHSEWTRERDDDTNVICKVVSAAMCECEFARVV